MFSELIAGTMRWGVWGANHSEKEVQKLIEVCLVNKITSFDHADIYGGHTTEELFGNAFAEMQIARENIQLISKCGIQMNSDRKSFPIKSYNYSKDYIINCVDESLRNLKTDYLDLLLLHRPSPLMNPEEIAAAFGILRSTGKVIDFGVSNFSVSQFDMIHQCFPYLVTNQLEISVNQLDSFYDGTVDQMMMKKLKPMAWSVLGNYFTSETEQNIRLRCVVGKLCQKYSVAENQILLAFLLKHPSNILPIIGTSKTETIMQLSEALSVFLEDDDWFSLLEASRGKEVD